MAVDITRAKRDSFTIYWATFELGCSGTDVTLNISIEWMHEVCSWPNINPDGHFRKVSPHLKWLIWQGLDYFCCHFGFIKHACHNFAYYN